MLAAVAPAAAPVMAASPVAAASAPAPTLLTPAGSQSPIEPILAWAAVAGAQRYRVQVSTTEDFAILNYDVTTTNTISTPELDLAAGLYFWRAAVTDGSEVGPFAVSTFEKTASLATPSQLGPADGSTLEQPEPPLLEWTSVAAAASYEVQLSLTPDMGQHFEGVTRSTSWVLDFMVPGQRRYWRVRAVGRNGTTTSDWSPVRSLQVNMDGVPGGLTPTSGATVRDMDVGWDPVLGAADYELAFTPGPIADWASPLAQTMVLMTTRFEFEDPTATGAVTWMWRVRARDHDGHAGPWTAAQLVTRSLAPRPTLLAPTNGAVVGDVAVLSWQPVERASHYRVDVSADPSFLANVDTHVTTETIFDLTTREEVEPYVLVKGATYYWRVVGLDRAMDLSSINRPASAWSLTRSFIYDPAVTQLLSPADGATISVPTLTWQPVNARFHRVTIKNSRGSIVDQAMTYANSYTPAKRLNPSDGPFTWYLERVALPGQVWSVVSWRTAIRSFTLTPIAATATVPTPTLPDGSHSLVSPSLAWTPVIGAAYYNLFLACDTPCPNELPWNDAPLHFPGYTYPRGELDVRSYAYLARAYDSNGNILATGPARSFVIDQPPAPTLTDPLDCGSPSCSTYAETPRLKWNLVDGATFYIAGIDISLSNHVDAPATTQGEVSPMGDAGNASRTGASSWSVSACVEDRCGPAARASFLKEAPATAPSEPDDGAVVVGPQVTFRWQDQLSSPKPAGSIGQSATEAWYYRLDVSNPSVGGSSWSDGVEHTLLLPLGTYGWRVDAFAGNGVPFADLQRSLTVTFPGPAVSQPANGSLYPRVPNLAWEPRPYTDLYEVEIYRGQSIDPSNRVVDFTTDQASLSPFEELSAGPYIWRVRSLIAGTSSSWSSTSAFRISEGDAPVPSAPADGSIDDDGILFFDWSTSARAVAYRIDTSSDPNFGTTRESVVTGQPRWAPLDTYPAGTWYWRVAELGPSGAVMARSPIRSVTVADSAIFSDIDPPSGTVSVGNGAVTNSVTVDLLVPATDASGVTTIDLSNDGASWTSRPYAPSQSWTLGAGDGVKTVYAKWQDGAGNWSAPIGDTIVLDTVGPTATGPTKAIVLGSTLTAGKPLVRFGWSGSDATSGVGHYEFALSTDGGAYTTLSSALASPTLDRALATGHSYRARVRAIDVAGNVGVWAYGSAFRLTAYQESSSAIHWSGTWRTGSSTSFWGGHDRYASAAGAKASLTSSGRSFAWVGSVGPSRGWAKVYVNGVLVKSVNLNAAANANRRILFTATWSTARSRTVTIRISGTAGHPRGDVDAFLTGS
jgi:hypothetical protein